MAYRIQRRHPRMSGGFPACAVATGRWRAGLAAPAIAAPLIAASVLAPAGVTATIHADPVCLNVPAQPGTVYDLSVYAADSGPLALSVGPAHGSLERSLHQVPPSWVRFTPDRGTPGSFLLLLTVPPGAATGAYWSDVTATSQPGAGGQADLGTAASTALVLTVGPSKTPPPPCGALDLAQSTGQFPPWPTRAFATTSMQQALERDAPPVNKATEWPTADPVYPGSTQAAGPRPSPEPAVPAAAYSPAAATSGGSSGLPANWPGYLVIGGVILLVLAGLRKWLRS